MFSSVFLVISSVSVVVWPFFQKHRNTTLQSAAQLPLEVQLTLRASVVREGKVQFTTEALRCSAGLVGWSSRVDQRYGVLDGGLDVCQC